MARGGARLGAGSKPTWKNGKTKTIRIPVAIADAVLALARELDEHGTIESVTDSKVVNLSGISVRHQDGVIAIYLEDLARAGYQILPESLSRLVKTRLDKSFTNKSVKTEYETSKTL